MKSMIVPHLSYCVRISGLFFANQKRVAQPYPEDSLRHEFSIKLTDSLDSDLGPESN